MAKLSIRDTFELVVLTLALYFVIQFALSIFFPEQFGKGAQERGITLSMQDETVKEGQNAIFLLRNKTDKTINLPNRCPMPPLDIGYLGDDGLEPRTTTETATACTPLTEIMPGQTITIDLAPWKYSLIGEFGSYQAKLNLPDGVQEEGKDQTLTHQFSYSEPGFMTKAFRVFVTKPLLNLFIIIASVMPGYSLGLTVIVITLAIKIILYFPTQKGLEGQKKLQFIQPKLDELKKKHKDDPKRFQQETMKVWKEHNVNPFGSCMPILIQFPILIGLFFVIRDGSQLELSRHMVYSMFSNLDWVFGTTFLGLDLLKPSIILMPPLLVVLQYIQMKLTFANAKKRQDEKDSKKKEKSKGPDMDAAKQTQQKIMLYGLPVMIGVFAFQFPAAVSLYWAVSTVFAIGQQLVVNKKVES